MEALQILKDESLTDNAQLLGRYLRMELNKIDSPWIEGVRGAGLLNAILVNAKSKETAWNICMKLRDNGLLAKPTHDTIIRLAPPLSSQNKKSIPALLLYARLLWNTPKNNFTPPDGKRKETL